MFWELLEGTLRRHPRTARIRLRGGRHSTKEGDREGTANFWAHGRGGFVLAAERGEAGGGGRELAFERATLWIGNESADGSERGSIFEQLTKFCDGAGGDHRQRIAKRAAASLLAALGVDHDVGQAQRCDELGE